MPMSEVSEQLPEGEPATLPKLVDTTGAVSSGRPSKANSPADLPLPRWLFNLIGHVLAALLGLALGYLILAWLRPLTFPLPWYH